MWLFPFSTQNYKVEASYLVVVSRPFKIPSPPHDFNFVEDSGTVIAQSDHILDLPDKFLRAYPVFGKNTLAPQ